MTAGASALLIVIGGLAAGVATLTKDGPDAPRIVTAIGQAAEDAPPAGIADDVPEPPHGAPAPVGIDPAATLPRTSDEADRTATREPRHQAGTSPNGTAQTGTSHTGTSPTGLLPNGASPNTKATPSPQKGKTAPAPVRPGTPAAPRQPAAVPATQVLTTRTELETREVPFETQLVRDPSLPRGDREVQTEGVTGEETLRYLVTFTDGKETDRKLMETTVTRQPQTRIVLVGVRRVFDRHDRFDRFGRDQSRCGSRGLELCVPLGRSACPPEHVPDDDLDRPESTPTLSGSVNVLDQDIQLLNGDTTGELPQMNCARP